MQKSPFLLALEQRRPLLLDGAMGTMLQASGLPAGVSPEEFCMERPDILRGIHGAYLEAGVDIITSCTFGGNRFKLPSGLDVFAFNRRMAETAREAARRSGRPVFVAGNVGPCGHFAKPLGDVEPEDMIAAFEEAWSPAARICCWWRPSLISRRPARRWLLPAASAVCPLLFP